MDAAQTSGTAGALNFDGVDDYVEGNISANSSVYTFSSWIYPTATSASWPTLLALRTTSGKGRIWLYYYSKSGVLALQHRNSAGSTATAVGRSTKVDLNAWNHIAVTYDTSTGLIEFYKNGAFIESSRLSVTGNVAFDQFRIGILTHSGTIFKGKIDEVRIYNRVLTAQEIVDHYNNGQGQYGVAESGLLAGWHFDEATGTTVSDYSGNGNTGILENGTTWVSGIVGSQSSTFAAVTTTALSFDGVDDYVEVELNASSNVYTFSSWIYPIETTNRWPTLLYLNRTSGNGKIWIYYYSKSGSLSLQYTSSDGSTATVVGYTAKVDLNSWNHIAITYNTSTGLVIFYKNGSFIESKRLSVTGNVAFGQFRVGASTSGSQAFKGIIDEVRIYNRVLTAQEIADHYKGGQGQYGVPESGLLAGWHFDEATGDTVSDYSGNGNTGILENGTTWVISDEEFLLLVQ